MYLAVMHERIAQMDEVAAAPDVGQVVVPSISVDTGIKAGGFPSAMEWPQNGVLFEVRDALLKALDRPEHGDAEFLWSMNGKLQVSSAIPETGHTLRMEFEERNGGVSAVLTHLNAEKGVSRMEGTQYPAGYERMRIAHATSQFIRERTAYVLSRKTS